MSEVYDRAAVSLLMADYAVADQIGKLQIVGGGVQVIGHDPNTGGSTPFALVVTVLFPPAVFNEQFSFEVVLEDSEGVPVRLGAPLAAVRGSTSPPSDVMRVAQSLQVNEPVFRGVQVPRHALPARHQLVLHFNTGLKIPTGQALAWRVRIDGASKPEWALPFFATGPISGPVIG